MGPTLRTVVLLVAGPVASALIQGCGDSPTQPDTLLEIVATSGGGQFGVAGQPLDQPLEALVRRTDTGLPEAGVEVEWTVRAGDASLDEGAPGTTDADGRVQVTVTLGAGTDTVRIDATARAHAGSAAIFEAYVVDHPQVAALSREVARGGDTITLTGRGFSATPESNVVLFSGIRGRVISADAHELRVEVPPCLPARTVGVYEQLGSLRSDPLPLRVEDAGHLTELARGGYVDVDERQRLDCLRLPGGGASYLLMALSAGTTGTARYGYVLSGLQEERIVSAGPAEPSRALPVGDDFGAAAEAVRRAVPFADAWEARLRASEGRLVRDRVPGARARPTTAPAAAPAVGEERTFSVLNAEGSFDRVTAVAHVVSAHAVLYVDRAAPSGGLTEADLEGFAAGFDEVIYPTDTKAYGEPSDLDGNGRVAILFTPTVNGLTPRGATAFVGGFFYGLDLLERDGSNRAEVFYALVPDPEGVYGDARGKDKVLRTVPPILAHEFQHMIHFNQRILMRGAERTEALWLSEGLAQMAEELVARAFDARGDLVDAKRFRDGNDDRARRYLARTDSTSVIVVTGQGSLEERGGGWLLALYLWDAGGQGDVLARLTQTTLTGTANVSAVTGQPWKQVFAGWGAALYLDGLSTGAFPFEYPTIDLSDRLGGAGDPFPLVPEVIDGDADFTRAGSLWSSSLKHYIVIPPSAGSTALRLGGAAAGNAPAEAGLRLRVVRIF